MKTKIRLGVAILLLFFGASLMAQQSNLLPTAVSNFNIGTVGNGHSNNNLSNVNVTTDYIYVWESQGLRPANAVQHYAVGSNAQFYNYQQGSVGGSWGETGFFNLPDHTTGTGNYMIVNGATSLNKKVWEYTVSNLIVGVRYDFTAYVCNLQLSSVGYVPGFMYLPKLQLKINNTNVGSPYQIDWVQGGQWTQWSNSWVATSTTATITIVDTDTHENGNDFGLDDIVFKMADGYSISAQDFSFTGCRCEIPSGQNYFTISLNGHYACNNPMGTTVVPSFLIQNLNGDFVNSGWNGSTIVYIQTLHGKCYFDYNPNSTTDYPKIRYIPNTGYYGSDQITFRASKYGLADEATISLVVADPPSDPEPNMSNAVQGSNGEYYLCMANVSSFNPGASWNPNGSSVQSGWDYYDSSGNYHYPNEFSSASVGDYNITFWATNACTGDSPSIETVLLHVCSSPVINNNNSLPVSICAGSELPLIDVDWHNSSGIAVPQSGWQYIRNGIWNDLISLGDLQSGDQVLYKAYNLCGNPVYSNPISITNGPEFYQNVVANNNPFPTDGVCPNYSTPKPSIPNNWYNTNGLTNVQTGWYWVTYDPSGNAQYDLIQGNNITLGNESRFVTCGLTSACGLTPYDPPFELLVYEAPGIDGLDELPEALDTCCVDTQLGFILPDLTPTGHYLQDGTGWEISPGQSQTGTYTSISPTQLLNETHSGRWLRYRVKKDCSSHSDAVSPSIRIWVGDKPSLNTNQIALPPAICAGTSASTINVQVVDWHLFDNPETRYEQWEVYVNGSWEVFDTYELSYNGKSVRYHAHNECGDVYAPDENGVMANVTEGPEFNNPEQPPAFEEYYCLDEQFQFPDWPTYEDHDIPTTPRWAYLDENGTIQPMPTMEYLSEEWDSVYVCCQLEFNCSGSIEYVESAFAQLILFGQPSLELMPSFPDEIGPVCAGAMNWEEWLPTDYYIDGHYEDSVWKLASTPNGPFVSLPDNLVYDGNNRWLQFYVYGCGDPVTSDPIPLHVADKPSVNTETVNQQGPVCAGRDPLEVFDVHVTDWNGMEDGGDQYWQVYYDGDWRTFPQFEIVHNGCPIRFVGRNNCGAHEPYPTLSSVQVITGPEFTPTFSYEYYFGSDDYLCVSTQPYILPVIIPDHINTHGLDDVTPSWEYSYNGYEFSECTSLDLSTDTIVYLRCSLHSDYCGGSVSYPGFFRLRIVGQPEVQNIDLVTTNAICVGTPLTLHKSVEWHQGNESTYSSWQYRLVGQTPYVDFNPEDGIPVAGEVEINYHAISQECDFEGYNNTPLTKTIYAAPAFVNEVQPFELERYCEDWHIGSLDFPEMTGLVENPGWYISRTTDPEGDYDVMDPNYTLHTFDNGRWIQFVATGCNEPIQHREEIHVDGTPWELYDVVPNMCAGQSLFYSLINFNSYPVTDREWRLDSESGQQFNPDEYTFEEEGTYLVFYRVGNDCGYSEWVGPESIVVAEGPRFDNSGLPSLPLEVCVGSTVGMVLDDNQVNPPTVNNPESVSQYLGWYFKFVDNGITQYRPVDLSEEIREECHGYELCYGVKGGCSDIPVYSAGISLHVFGNPEITSIDPPVLDFCEGDPVNLSATTINIDYHHGEGYVQGCWQIQSQDGWVDLPESWSSEHDGKAIRYHIVNMECLDMIDNSEPFTVHVAGLPVILLPESYPEESISICSGDALGFSAPDVTFGTTGEWQVSADGQNWNSQLNGIPFDPEHVDETFNGKWLRYYAHGDCGDDHTDPIKINLLESANVSIAGSTQVAVATSYWPGKYYYCVDGSSEGLNWTIEPDIWEWGTETLDGNTCFWIVVSTTGQATLTAKIGDGTCGSDTIYINASHFGVEEQPELPVKIYPNPAKHQVTVESENMRMVRVYDLIGQLVLTYPCQGDRQLTFDVEGLAATFYVIEIQTDKGIARKPLSVYR